MSTTGEELLRSFDLLPEPEKREVASEIIRRAFASTPELDDAQLAALYAEFAEEDRNLAEEGLEDYQRGLAAEDAE
ncbi:MAG: hypothetical protein M3539_15125 [Acidobacteriota bacterium]|nr:hypothetical protein [Acidobacteriota bacterium]